MPYSSGSNKLGILNGLDQLLDIEDSPDGSGCRIPGSQPTDTADAARSLQGQIRLNAYRGGFLKSLLKKALLVSPHY